jgi:tetratricopeptide (TPR) repeat protein
MDMSKLFASGSQAFERGNWDLAIVLWQQLLAMQPDHLDARRLLREAENRRVLHAGSGTGAKVMAIVRGIPSFVAFALHMMTKNYDRAMIDCEKVLTHDPNCMPMLWGLTAAATKGDHIDIAAQTLEYMREAKPNNTSIHRRLGHLYREKGQISEAIESWQNIRKVAPNDREAQVMLRDLAAEKTMVDGHYNTATDKNADFTKSLKNRDESEDLEQEHKIIRTDEDMKAAIDRVTRDIEQNPENKRYIIQLGDLYRRSRDFTKARELYEQAHQIDAMDYTIQERLGELRIDEYTEEEAEVAKALEKNPQDTAAQARLKKIRQEKFDFSLEEYRRQIKVRPTDAPLRAKLGDLLFQAKRFDEAAPEYQKAASDPRLRRACRKRLGLCLYNTKKYQLAASQFEQAAEGGTAASREVREILYYLAITLEHLDDLDRAEAVLRKIFDADMSYKDVQERLDRVMQAKAAKASGSSPVSEPPSGEGL